MTIPAADDDLGRFLERVVLPDGWRVLHEPSVTSTNDLAREAARRGWPERSVFVADYQTAGRGRQGRSWTAPPRTGLLFSVLLRPRDAAPYVQTTLAAVAVCEAIERLVGLQPAIKWPNDLLVDDRKVAGILAEATDDGAERTVVVGVGVNVREPSELPVDLPGVISLSAAAGWSVPRGDLLVVALERMDAWLALPPDRARRDLWAAREQRLWRRSQRVRIREGRDSLEGVILGVALDGTLRLQTSDGSERRVVAGEILP